MNLSFKQYRAVDLVIFALILIVCEAVAGLAANAWFKVRPFTLSVVVLITAIVMIRWGWQGVIHSVIGGVVFSLCIVKSVGADLQNYYIYIIGNIFSALALLMIKFVGKEKIQNSALLSAVFVLAVYASMIFGRWVVAVILKNPASFIFNLLYNDIITLLFSLIAIELLRKLDGMFEDQKTYLLRTQKQRDEQNQRFGK